MYIDNDTLVREFYHTIKEQFPHVSLGETDRICKSPFHFARWHMNRARLSTIRIKQFGTFFLYPNKILKLLEANDYNLKCGAITEATHEKAKDHLFQVYAEVTAVRAASKWGIGLDIVDTSEEPLSNDAETTPTTSL